MGILTCLAGSLPFSFSLRQQLCHAESGEKLSTFTRLLGVQEAPRPSVVTTGGITASPNAQSISSPPPTAALAASQPLCWLLDFAGGNGWPVGDSRSLPVWPWGIPATAAGSCTRQFCSGWSNMHNTSWHGPWSGRFVMEMLPAELPLLLSNTLTLLCLILHGLYEIIGDF